MIGDENAGGAGACRPLFPWLWEQQVPVFAVSAAGCFWSTVSRTSCLSSLGTPCSRRRTDKFLARGRARAGRRTEGPNIKNVDGPNAEVMALSAVAETIAEYKRALATNDFKDEMCLDARERTLVVGTADHALASTYMSPSRRLEASSIVGRRSTADGIFNLIAGPDRFISKEVRVP